MKLKKTKREEVKKIKDKAKALYKLGYTTREVSALLLEKGIKRSHTWVASVVAKVSK